LSLKSAGKNLWEAVSTFSITLHSLNAFAISWLQKNDSFFAPIYVFLRPANLRTGKSYGLPTFSSKKSSKASHYSSVRSNSKCLRTTLSYQSPRSSMTEENGIVLTPSGITASRMYNS
jgi:hypothetical protein